MAGVEPKEALPQTHWRMQMIFDEGHDIHRKWQKRVWDLGRLTGQFYCMNCHQSWWGDSPQYCDACGSKRYMLIYQEVPLSNPTLRMVGHADGQDGDGALIEIKSIGVNTLRWEAPHLLQAATYRLHVNGRYRDFLDLDELWDSIRVPFPSHIRQAHLYSFLGAPPDEIFLYESKWNQRTKEFVVKYQEHRITGILNKCRQVVQALDGGPAPECPFDGCADCRRYEEGKHGRDRTSQEAAGPTPVAHRRRFSSGLQRDADEGRDPGLQRGDPRAHRPRLRASEAGAGAGQAQ